MGCGFLDDGSSVAPLAEWAAWSTPLPAHGSTVAAIGFARGDWVDLPFVENGTVPFFRTEVVEAEAARFDPEGVLSRKVPFWAVSGVERREPATDRFGGDDGISLAAPLAAAVAAI